MTLFSRFLMAVLSRPSVTTTAMVMTPRTTAYSAIVWPASSLTSARRPRMKSVKEIHLLRRYGERRTGGRSCGKAASHSHLWRSRRIAREPEEDHPFGGRTPARADSVSSAPVATIIDGKQVAANVRTQVAKDAAELRRRTGHTPGLVTILVGEDPASEVYVRNKIKACEEAGMASFHEPMAATSTQAQVLAMVERYNGDDRVD